MLRRLFLLFFLLLLAYGFYLWIERKERVAKVLSEAVGLPITVGDVELSTHGFSLLNAEVANPFDPDAPPVAITKNIRVEMNLWELWQNPMEIDKVAIDGINLYLPKPDQDYIQHAVRFLQEQLFPSNPSKTTPPKEKEEVERHYHIKTLEINHVTLWSIDGKKPLSTINHIKLQEIGSNTPQTLEQITYEILEQVLQELGYGEYVQHLSPKSKESKDLWQEWKEKLKEEGEKLKKLLPRLGS